MNTCIVCGNNQFSVLYDGILKCKVCSHVVADLNLTSEELFEIYKKNYFFGEEYSNYVNDEQVLKKNFKLRLKILNQYLKPDRHKTLFEVGCAYGFFLDMARGHFEKVSGIDITEDGIHYAKHTLGLDVVQADLLQHELGNQRLDVVCMWDTIEHLSQPHLYLQKLSPHVPSGGLIAITTGNIASLNAKLSKERWRLLHPPTHIHYFTLQSLGRLLENYGFKVMYKSHCGFYRSIDNVAYNLFVLRLKNNTLYKALKTLRVTSFNFYLNMYDIMYVIAEKK